MEHWNPSSNQDARVHDDENGFAHGSADGDQGHSGFQGASNNRNVRNPNPREGFQSASSNIQQNSTTHSSRNTTSEPVLHDSRRLLFVNHYPNLLRKLPQVLSVGCTTCQQEIYLGGYSGLRSLSFQDLNGLSCHDPAELEQLF